MNIFVNSVVKLNTGETVTVTDAPAQGGLIGEDHKNGKAVHFNKEDIVSVDSPSGAYALVHELELKS